MASDGSKAAVAWWVEPAAPAGKTAVASDTATAPKPRQATLAPPAALPRHLRCAACGRANPADAYYCHFDGQPLFEELRQQAQHVGAVPFPAPFCFAGGRACANFNQLAIACATLWDEARALLTEGIWCAFFAGMGRLDLAAVARQAAADPDADRGLSRLLERFPADPQFLRPPALAVQRGDLHFDGLTPGTDYTFDLVIENRGTLLLHGSAASPFDWLAFGDSVQPLPVAPEPAAMRIAGPPARPLAADKYFQTRQGCVIPVRILGSKLRAGLQPMRGELVVDTNGGAAVVPVRVTVPVRPFPRGQQSSDLLADVRSPRELAVRARRSPQEAGKLFDNGAVQAWYASNGWTYPLAVADAVGTGAGAVQQFFEVLGLTTPPRLEVAPAALTLQGRPGATLTTVVTLHAVDRKPVYARAWGDQRWLTAETPRQLGTRVEVPVRVVVPAHGQTASAQLTVQGNARQRFVVPITVTGQAH